MNVLHFSERGSGRALLLVHGLMVAGDMYEPLVAHYARRYRVIIPDLRGHGHSRGLPPPYTVPQLAADLAPLLDQLDIASTIVFGYSQGGAVAQLFALEFPARCTRLVLACTYAFNMATAREKAEGRVVPLLIRALGMKRFARFVVSQGMTRVPKDRRERVVDLIAAQDRDLMVRAWKAAMAFDSRRRLREIACPTLVVAGGQDRAVPMHHAAMLHRGIAGSILTVIDDADHALIWANPGALIRAVDEFLGEDAAKAT